MQWIEATIRVMLKREDRIHGAGEAYILQRIATAQDTKEKEELENIYNAYYKMQK